MSTNELIERLRKTEDDESDFNEEGEDQCLSETDHEEKSPTVEKQNENDNGKTKKKRWRWTREMANYLIYCLNTMKTEYEFLGKDFEADLVKLYGEIRVMMAKKFEANDFGPIELAAAGEDLTKAELDNFKVQLAIQKKQIRTGYERVKEKSKALRQQYRKAVTEGRRSGSGRLVCDNWDTLKTLWGGSPAVMKVNNSLTSLDGNNSENDSDEEECVEQKIDEVDDEEGDSEDEDGEKGKNEISETSSQAYTSSDSVAGTGAKRALNSTPKFVDNKRKMLEKNLSAHQRDQLYLKVAMDDLKMKENLVSNLTEATMQSNKALEKVSESIASVGKSIGDGLALLAAALAPPKPNPPPPNSFAPVLNVPYMNYQAANQALPYQNAQMYPDITPDSSFENDVEKRYHPL